MDIIDRILGATALGGLAFIGGQIPPFTATPEEAASVPIAATIGGIVGFKKIESFFKNLF